MCRRGAVSEDADPGLEMWFGRVNGCSPLGFSRQQPESCLAGRFTIQRCAYAPAAQKPVVHRMRGPIMTSGRPSLYHIGCVPESPFPESLAPATNAPRGTHKASRIPSWESVSLSFSPASTQPSRASSYTPLSFFVLFLFVPYL